MTIKFTSAHSATPAAPELPAGCKTVEATIARKTFRQQAGQKVQRMQATGKTRILFINHTSRLGGGELALVNLVTHLDRGKIEPVVLLFADGQLSALLRDHAEVHISPLSSSVLDTRKDTVGIGLLMRISDVFATIGFVYRLQQTVRKLQVNIVHTNSLKADIVGGFAARLARVPVIWHVRDRIAADYLPGPVVSCFRMLARIIPNYVVANSMCTLSTIEGGAGALSSRMSLERSFQSRSSVVHDGVSQDHAKPQAQTSRERPVIGLIGRISPWKGQDVFLRAAAIVRRQFPGTVFRIIGSALFGEEAYEAELIELCNQLGLADSVEFTGFITDVGRAISELDVLVHASTLGEPFGQVIIEGMAAGKPVIATNGGGVPEIVLDGVTGILVPMKAVEEMAEAIVYLLENPDVRQAMGSKGKARVSEYFSINRTAEKMQYIYQAMLDKTPNRRSGRSQHDLYPSGSSLTPASPTVGEK